MIEQLFKPLMQERIKPIYIRFECSGDYCGKQFDVVKSNKDFINFRYFIVDYSNGLKEYIECPYCDHYQSVHIKDFMQLDENRYVALL